MGETDVTRDTTSIGRREAMKKAAVAGAVVAWGAPVVQTLGSGAAFAQAASACGGCFPEFGFVVIRRQDTNVRLVIGEIDNPTSPVGPQCGQGCGPLGRVTVTWTYDEDTAVNIGAVTNPNPGTWQAARTGGAPSSATVTCTVSSSCNGIPFSCAVTGAFTWAAGGSVTSTSNPPGGGMTALPSPGNVPDSIGGTNSCAGSFCPGPG